MSHHSPSVTQAYETLVGQKTLIRDDAQRSVALSLDVLLGQITKKPPPLWKRLFKKAPSSIVPKGFYLQGEVGRGKTLLMDLFFEALPLKTKHRVHFHAFMQDVQRDLHRLRQQKTRDPIKYVAAHLAQNITVLCLDEFQVTDIADAMVLKRLFEALRKEKVLIVLTSNLLPEELYREGIGRQAFLPFIPFVRKTMEVFSLAAQKDYRLEKPLGEPFYLFPLNAQTEGHLQTLWLKLTEHPEGEAHTLTILERTLILRKTWGKTAWISFEELCKTALGPCDYLLLAEKFSIFFLVGVPIFSDTMRNELKRFITAIDTFYDSRVRLVISAEDVPQNLYSPKEKCPEAFFRTISRLEEMRSEEYWKKTR